MPDNRTSRLINALALMAAGILVYIIIDASARPAPAQNFGARAATPLPFKLSRHGDYIRLDQAGYRVVHFRESLLISFAHYSPGQGPADQFSWPVILVKISGHEYRLDCADMAQVNYFADFVLGVEATKTEKMKEALKEAGR